MGPSDLHDMRSVAVNAERLAFVALNHGIQRHIRHSSPKLLSHLTDFVSLWKDELHAEIERHRKRDSARRYVSNGKAQRLPTTAGVEGLEEDRGLRHAAQISLMHKNAFGFTTIEAPKAG